MPGHVIRRITTSSALAVIASVLAAVIAAAGPPAAYNSTVARANQIMSMTYQQFAGAAREAPFEWSSDGCSSPIPLDGYRIVFAPACRQHDFGYRNYGARWSQKLSPNQETKRWIDARFAQEMGRICNDDYVGPMVADCLAIAGLYFNAVARRGGAAYF